MQPERWRLRERECHHTGCGTSPLGSGESTHMEENEDTKESPVISGTERSGHLGEFPYLTAQCPVHFILLLFEDQ